MRQPNVMNTGSERALRTALAAGDQGAYHDFVSTHRPAMVRLASEMLGNGDVAEEVVQDTFEAIFKDVGMFRGESSLKTWSYRILVNRARRVGKRERRTVPFTYLDRGRSDNRFSREGNLGSETLLETQVHARSEADPQTAAIVRQRVQILAEGLRKLPERQRKIVVLRDLEGRNSGEVSELLDITAGNQRVLLHRGRTVLRSEIEMRDGVEPGTPGSARYLN